MNAVHWLTVIVDDVERQDQLVELGASPAELDYNIEAERPMSWHSHDGEAELRLWEVA
jgi:hypothetical protein